jgi:drug/metabolite transporter (DMT)-like permease
MFCLSVNDVNVKGLNNYFPVWEVIFFRAVSGIIVSLILVGYFGVNKIKTRKPVRHFIRAFSAVGCVVFYFFGLKYLFLSENVAIVHSAPILAAVLAVPILGEKLGIKRSVAIVLGFVGVLIIVKPGSNLFQLVSLLPFISAVFMASVYLSTRSLMNTESSVAIIFYYSLALLITSLFFFPKDFALPNYFQLMLLMSLGIMGSLGHYFMSQAAKFADVVVISF